MYMHFKPSKEFKDFVDSTILGKNPVKTIAIEGPAGSGKTVATRAIFSLLKQKFPGKYTDDAYLRYVCTKETTFTDFTVDKTLKNGNLDEIESVFLQMIQTPSVLVIDEYKLAQPDVLAGLNDFLDHDQAKVLPNGKKYNRHPDCIIILTTNPQAYAGVKRQHGGFTDRLPTFFMGYSSEEVAILSEKFTDVPRATILKACKFAEMIRNAQRTKNLQMICSTRGLETFLVMIDNGCNISTAIRATFKPSAEEEVIINEFCKMAFEAEIIENEKGEETLEMYGSLKKDNEDLKKENKKLSNSVKKLKDQLEDVLSEG